MRNFVLPPCSKTSPWPAITRSKSPPRITASEFWKATSAWTPALMGRDMRGPCSPPTAACKSNSVQIGSPLPHGFSAAFFNAFLLRPNVCVEFGLLWFCSFLGGAMVLESRNEWVIKVGVALQEIQFAVLFTLFDFTSGSRPQCFERMVGRAENVYSSAVPVFGVLTNGRQQCDVGVFRIAGKPRT